MPSHQRMVRKRHSIFSKRESYRIIQKDNLELYLIRKYTFFLAIKVSKFFLPLKMMWRPAQVKNKALLFLKKSVLVWLLTDLSPQYLFWLILSSEAQELYCLPIEALDKLSTCYSVNRTHKKEFSENLNYTIMPTEGLQK